LLSYINNLAAGKGVQLYIDVQIGSVKCSPLLAHILISIGDVRITSRDARRIREDGNHSLRTPRNCRRRLVLAIPPCVVLELRGNDASVSCADADVAATASGLVMRATFYSGQYVV
jgi:hypothetical protein